MCRYVKEHKGNRLCQLCSVGGSELTLFNTRMLPRVGEGGKPGRLTSASEVQVRPTLHLLLLYTCPLKGTLCCKSTRCVKNAVKVA